MILEGQSQKRAQKKSKKILHVEKIYKRFGGVLALQDVSLSLASGTITALVGGNAAGKSTLIKIISGSITPDSGYIQVFGKRYKNVTIKLAKDIGIQTIYQDLALCDNLDVLDNLFLGNEVIGNNPIDRGLGIIDRKKMSSSAAEIFSKLVIDVPDFSAETGRLSGGQRQAIALGRIFCNSTRIILMDEPTAALGLSAKKRFQKIVKDLLSQGLAFLYVSHDIHEVYDIADYIAILFRGKLIQFGKTSEYPKSEVTKLLVLGPDKNDSMRF
jgi:ABC-type sugar transport system ATPase subunit